MIDTLIETEWSSTQLVYDADVHHGLLELLLTVTLDDGATYLELPHHVTTMASTLSARL